MKNLTPQHLRCGPLNCPSVHELEEGRLLIVGESARQDITHGGGETVLIDRLRQFADGDVLEIGKDIIKGTIPPDIKDFELWAGMMVEAADALRSQAERIARLEEALKPFANIPSVTLFPEGDMRMAKDYWVVIGTPDRTHFTQSDLVRARAALSQQEGST